LTISGLINQIAKQGVAIDPTSMCTCLSRACTVNPSTTAVTALLTAFKAQVSGAPAILSKCSGGQCQITACLNMCGIAASGTPGCNLAADGTPGNPLTTPEECFPLYGSGHFNASFIPPTSFCLVNYDQFYPMFLAAGGTTAYPACDPCGKFDCPTIPCPYPRADENEEVGGGDQSNDNNDSGSSLVQSVQFIAPVVAVGCVVLVLSVVIGVILYKRKQRHLQNMQQIQQHQSTVQVA